MHLRPLGFLLLDNGFEEMIRGFRSLSGELVGFSSLRDEAEVIVDFANDAGFFPGFALGGILGGRLIRLPSTFREHPATSPGGLDEKNVVLVGRERDNSGNQALSLGPITCGTYISKLTGYKFLRGEIGMKGKLDFIERSRENLRWLTRPVRDCMDSCCVGAMVVDAQDGSKERRRQALADWKLCDVSARCHRGTAQ